MKSGMNGKKLAVFVGVLIGGVIVIAVFLGKGTIQQAALFKATGTTSLTTTSVSTASPLACVGALQRLQINTPNGGSSYQVGQQVTITWSSCSIPSNQSVVLALKSSLGIQIPMVTTLNDGSETITIPSVGGNPQQQLATGNYYKFAVSLATNALVTDSSDTLSTITNPNAPATNGILLLTPATNQSVVVTAVGTSPKRALFTHAFKLKNTSAQTLWVNCDMMLTNVNSSTNSSGSSVVSCVTTPTMSGWASIAPGAEIQMNRQMLYTPTQTGTQQVQASITGILYKTAQSGTVISQPPQANPAFQSGWTTTTPMVTL